MKELEKILKLENYKIIKIEERREKNKMLKVIYVESKNKKEYGYNSKEYRMLKNKKNVSLLRDIVMK